MVLANGDLAGAAQGSSVAGDDADADTDAGVEGSPSAALSSTEEGVQ